MLELTIPFYYKSKLAFHVGLIERDNGSHDILTNIPKQILNANNWAIAKLSLEQSLLKRTKEQYLNSIAEIIIADVQAQLFFYSNFIDLPEFEIRKSFEEISHCKSNLIIMPNKVFTRFHEPVRFYVLCSLYTSTRVFEPCFFKENVPSISRLEFEKAIPSVESKLLYVDFYAKTNQFRFIDDGEFNIFFLLNDEVPQLIFVKHV